MAPLFGELFGDERVLREWFNQLVMHSMTATLSEHYVDFFALGQGVLHMLADIRAHLQELLAAKYDGDPLVHEVAVTSCMMFTAEPFSIDTHPGALDPLRKAGMTDANYKACLNRIVDDYAPWKTTRFETPLNPFKSTDGGYPVHDVQFTLAWMDDCRKRAGDRCVFDNHDLDVPATVDRDLQTIYAAMRKSGAEVEFQTGPAEHDWGRPTWAPSSATA